MDLSDLYAWPPQSERLTDERVDLLWPQARGELWAYANALERGGAGLTAAQLRMAVQLADEAVRRREDDKPMTRVWVRRNYPAAAHTWDWDCHPDDYEGDCFCDECRSED